MPRVLVTGASGLLGRAIVSRFSEAGGWVVTGCAFSRARDGLVQLDVRDAAAIDAAIATHRPNVVIHAAAQRRPDACELQESESETLNIDAVWLLGRAAAHAGAAFIHISTDYIFDGTAAPYKETDSTHPLNAYGRQKLRGEHAAIAAHPHAVVLRVPVLYGPTPDLAESAVTAFANVVRAAGTPASIDDWQIRVPTLTTDIAATLVNISRALTEDSAPIETEPVKRGGIFHYSSAHSITRWGLCELFSQMLGGLPLEHIKRLEGAPPGAPRPYDCLLDCTKLAATGLAAPHTPLEEGLRAVLGLPHKA